MSPELSDLEHSLNFPAVFFSSTLAYPHLLHSGRSAADQEIGLSVDSVCLPFVKYCFGVFFPKHSAVFVTRLIAIESCRTLNQD